MASRESFIGQFDWTGENNGKPHDAPEIREHIAGLLHRASEIVIATPEATSIDTLTPDYHLAEKEIKVGGFDTPERVVLTAGKAEQVVWETYAPEGSIANVAQSYTKPDRGARHHFDALSDRAQETGDTAYLTHVLRREVVLGGVSAEQRMTTETELYAGEPTLKSVKFALVRPFAGDETSGDTLFQTVAMGQPGPFNAALFPRDYITNSRGRILHRDQEALSHAAAVLPEDPTFPMSQSLGLPQIEAFLQ